MICLNDLVQDSDFPLPVKFKCLFFPPSYLADGLADYLDDISYIPFHSLRREITLTLFWDITYFLNPYVCIQIPLVSISPSPKYPLDRAVLLHGDSRSTPAFWRNNGAFSQGVWQIIDEEFKAGGEEVAAKTYAVDLHVFEEDGARIPYIYNVHSDPLNPNDFKRLKKEPFRHLLPGYALG